MDSQSKPRIKNITAHVFCFALISNLAATMIVVTLLDWKESVTLLDIADISSDRAKSYQILLY